MKKTIVALAFLIFAMALYLAYVVITAPTPVTDTTPARKAAPGARDKLEELAREKGRLQAQLADVRRKKDRLETELAALRRQHARLKKELAGLKAKQAERAEEGVAFRLFGEAFKPGQATLSAKGRAEVANIAAQIKAQAGVKIRVEGHSDSTPLSAATRKKHTDNLGLSLKRAETVARALIRHGVDAKRVSVAGFGPNRPLESNETEEGRAKNRRVDIVFVK